MKLTELLNTISQQNKEGYVNIDDWRWPDVDHLVAMGFDFVDDYKMSTDRDPKIVIYKKKDKGDKVDEGKEIEYFFIEEPNKQKRRFKDFNDVIDYFDHYPQPEIDKKLK